MKQPIPNVSQEDVDRVVRRDFGITAAGEVLALLRGFATESRVQMAILKVANGDIDMIQEAGYAAVQDFRDVLSWAEYPRYMREIGFGDTTDGLKEEVIIADWNQYQEWLQKV